MNNKSFKDLDELLRVFKDEKKLIKQLFEYREGSFAYADALSQVDYDSERFEYLIGKGVIRTNGETVELEDIYQTFFEEILQANEEITIQSVKECLDSIIIPIRDYMDAGNQARRNEYVSKVRRSIRTTSQRVLQNVIKLKRKVDSTYKDIPEYSIKKRNLLKLQEQKKSIEELIKAVEKEIKKQTTFFETASDTYLQTTINEATNTFTDAYHNLVDIERQIIDYLNQIEYQNRLNKKLRKVTYLMEKHTLREASNIDELVKKSNGLWLENRSRLILPPSIEQLRATDLTDFLVNFSKDLSLKSKRKPAHVIISDEEIKGQVEKVNIIDPTEVFNAFKSSGIDLFKSILQYDFHFPVEEDERIRLFCQIATQYIDYVDISSMTQVFKGYEYPLITPDAKRIKLLEQLPI